MNMPTTPMRGLMALSFTADELRHPILRKLRAALAEERELMRDYLEPEQPIGSTSILRGELRLVKRILALTDEVGPESRQSEATGPESAFPARTAAGFPPGYER